MQLQDLKQLLDELISTWENEVIEFKQADNSYSTDKIAQYLSALSNEANLRDKEWAWLVFGVNNKTRQIIGTNYRPEKEHLDSLKQQMIDCVEPKGFTFRDIIEYNHLNGRVIIFKIPSAPKGIPIACKGHYYARAGESITALSDDKRDEIRNQTQNTDWTAQLIPDATIDDLDKKALEIAKQSFSKKNPRITEQEIETWTDFIFLERIRLAYKGQLNRAALLLLGRPESVNILSPHLSQITWKLVGEQEAYEHFTIPFLLATTEIYKNIRNINIRITPECSLLPVEIKKYEQESILEALHNCIAHQDYSQNARILVTEYKDRLVFDNVGNFYDGKPEIYIEGNGNITPKKYRNPCLINAMVALQMIDSMGRGINRIVKKQRERYFPLPDYDLQNDKVSMTLHGAIMDEAYTQILLYKKDLPNEYVVALDKIQKKLPINTKMLIKLRQEKLVEGHKSNLHISSVVAMLTEQKTEYIKMRSFNNKHYEELIISYIKEFKSASRQDIDVLLLDTLSTSLDKKQKKIKINNLLSNMRRRGIISNFGSDARSKWIITQ